jgi:hypothetical protein
LKINFLRRAERHMVKIKTHDDVCQ